MSRYLQISGISGLVLTLFGLIAYFFTGNIRDPYVLSHLGLGILCLLTYLLTQGGRLFRSLRSRSTRAGIHSAFYSLFFIGVLIMLNFLSTRHHQRWDLTEAKVFSLSPQSVIVVEQLKQDLEIYGFFERGQNLEVADLIKSYEYHSPKIRFQAIDPDRHPEMARRWKIQRLNTLHIRYGDESTNITDTSEEAVTNAILKLTKATKKIVYFLTGHGEPNTKERQDSAGYGAAKDALENENFQVKELLLSAQESVPEETSLFIVANPKKPLLDHEIDAIDRYTKSGGRLLVMASAQVGKDLGPFLKDWGVDLGDDIVVDQVIRLFAGPSLGVEPIAQTYSPTHPITRGFRERTIFPMVRSVEANSSPKEGLDVTSLIQTSPTSWAEQNIDGVFKQGKASFEPEDEQGPVSIGVAVKADLKKIGSDKEGDVKIVVVGTGDFANNRSLNIYFNRDLFLNMVNWLVGEEELISIRPRSIRSSRIQLTEKEGNMVFYLSFLILPEFLLIIGLGVWWRRR